MEKAQETGNKTTRSAEQALAQLNHQVMCEEAAAAENLLMNV